MSADRPLTLNMSVFIDGYDEAVTVSASFDPQDTDSVDMATVMLMRKVTTGMDEWATGVAEWNLSER